MAILDGILVVALEQAVAAPYCTRLLAESGARVIKLEREEGDFARAYDSVVNGESAYFIWLNSGKESLRIDIKNSSDRALLNKILLKADVFIQNLKPGATDKLGLDYNTLANLNERIIVCNISGYGHHGPYAKMKAYDALVQAETALCSVTGPPGVPSKVGASICDISTGLTAYSEILKALYNREKRQSGSNIDVSLFGVLSEWMSVPLSYFEYSGKLLQGTGLDHAQLAPYGSFESADGPVFIVIQNGREWVRFCESVLERPAVATDPRFCTNANRVENLEELKKLINESFHSVPRETLIAKLQAAEIACGNINNIADLSKHPALVRCEVTSDGKTFRTVKHVGSTISGLSVPKLGEHDELIRKEFSE